METKILQIRARCPEGQTCTGECFHSLGSTEYQTLKFFELFNYLIFKHLTFSSNRCGCYYNLTVHWFLLI